MLLATIQIGFWCGIGEVFTLYLADITKSKMGLFCREKEKTVMYTKLIQNGTKQIITYVDFGDVLMWLMMMVLCPAREPYYHCLNFLHHFVIHSESVVLIDP